MARTRFRWVQSQDASFQVEMSHKIWRQGLHIAESPIIFTDLFEGGSKMPKGIVKEARFKVWRPWIQNGGRRKLKGTLRQGKTN